MSVRQYVSCQAIFRDLSVAVRERAYSVSRAEDRALHRKFGAVVALVQLPKVLACNHSGVTRARHSALVCAAGDWVQLVWFTWHMQVGLGLMTKALVLLLLFLGKLNRS